MWQSPQVLNHMCWITNGDPRSRPNAVRCYRVSTMAEKLIKATLRLLPPQQPTISQNDRITKMVEALFLSPSFCQKCNGACTTLEHAIIYNKAISGLLLSKRNRFRSLHHRRSSTRIFFQLWKCRLYFLAWGANIHLLKKSLPDIKAKNIYCPQPASSS